MIPIVQPGQVCSAESLSQKFFHCLSSYSVGAAEEETCKYPNSWFRALHGLYQSDYSNYLIHRSLECHVPSESAYKQLCDFFVTLHQDIFMVEPFPFFIVEFRTSFAATMQIEQLDEFIHWHNFGRYLDLHPNKARKLINRFRQIVPIHGIQKKFSLFSGKAIPMIQELPNGHRRACSVYRFRPVSLQQWQVSEFRHSSSQPKVLVQQYVQRSWRQPFFSTNHVWYFHQVVVNDISFQVVGRQFHQLIYITLIVEG